MKVANKANYTLVCNRSVPPETHNSSQMVMMVSSSQSHMTLLMTAPDCGCCTVPDPDRFDPLRAAAFKLFVPPPQEITHNTEIMCWEQSQA